MANLTEASQWEAGIYQIETTDPVAGGPDGISNIQAKQLGNRTRYLKGITDEVVAARGGKANLDERLDQYDAFAPEQQTDLVAGILAALSMGGVLGREIDVLRKRVLAQGKVTIKNKFVLAGYVLTKSDIRALHLSATGTVGTGVSKARIDGIIVSHSDDDYSLSVPTNDTAQARTYYAVLRKQGGVYGLEIVETVPGDALLLYRLDVPANDTANNLNVVTLTDQRVVQANNAWVSSFTPFSTVALQNTLPAADYGIELEIESATDMAAVGVLSAYDKATNGFKVKTTGTADNVVVRWTLLNPSYQ